jgi:hypothetical protein
MSEDYPNSETPITHNPAPDPQKSLIGYLLKILLVVAGGLLLLLAVFILVIQPISYMRRMEVPMHMQWTNLTEQELSRQASRYFEEIDRRAVKQNFTSVKLFKSYAPSPWRREGKLYLSPDSRVALIAACLWYQDHPQFFLEFLTFFDNGRELVTTNLPPRGNHKEDPEWRTELAMPRFRDLFQLLRKHNQAMEDAGKTGGTPILLTPETAESTVTQFQDKANAWRVEQGLLQKDNEHQVYRPTYQAAVKNILLQYKRLIKRQIAEAKMARAPKKP